MATQILKQRWIAFNKHLITKINYLQEKVNAQNKSQKICKHKHERFYPVSILVTYVQSPNNPLQIFLILILIHPKINFLYTTWQITFGKSVQLFSAPRRRQLLYTSSLHQEDTLVQLFSLNDYNESYKTWNLYVIVNKVSYRWTLRILHTGIRIMWRNESGN